MSSPRHPGHVRRRLILWWLELADELDALQSAISEAPEGAFTQEERDDATYELSQTVWDVMVNHRPKLERPRVRNYRLARRNSARAVLLIVRDMRAADPKQLIEARHIHAEWERQAGDYFGTSTVHHALTALRRAGALVKDPLVGWTPTPKNF